MESHKINGLTVSTACSFGRMRSSTRARTKSKPKPGVMVNRSKITACGHSGAWQPISPCHTVSLNRWSCKNLRAPARMQLNQQFGVL